jgi:RNA polymerase sigma-70 factor (ECF subfamily)
MGSLAEGDQLLHFLCYTRGRPWKYTMTMISEQEQERFMRLWTSAQPAVVNYLHAMVRDPAMAKDLVQETAMVLFRRFGDYDGQRPFLAWALGVAKFQVLGLHRDGARSFITFDTELFEKFTEVWAETAPTASEHSAVLEICLERLSARPRQMVRWRYFEELSSEEIAVLLGTKGAAVRVALQRIREQLRVCIERQMGLERRSA